MKLAVAVPNWCVCFTFVADPPLDSPCTPEKLVIQSMRVTNAGPIHPLPQHSFHISRKISLIPI